MTDRSDLLRAIHTASDGRTLSQAVAALDHFDRQAAAQASAGRELDLGAQMVAQRLEPVPVHELHTAATDWLADVELPGQDGYRTEMIAEASTWFSRLDEAVRSDGQELAEQARGRAATLASAYGPRARAAEREFLQTVGYLSRHQGASGLPQIDQTIDPNNAPAPTPYPTEVFDNFAEEQDPFNGVETNNHQSGASSEGAPMLQQLQQQQGPGSGFGSGPERPDEHSTSFDTSDSYAEVPLGAPGVIPTSGPGQGPAAQSSQPNPIDGQVQDAGADRRHASVHGYSLPDAFGYRWVMTGEVMHPFHERCASAHWPEESCGGLEHTASVAIGYQMDLDRARHLAQAERVGAQEGLRAFHASRNLAELVAAHNRFASAWGETDRTAEDSAVLHGFMAVVRPVMAEMAPQNIQATAGSEPGGKVVQYISEMAKAYHTAASGGCANCQSGDCQNCRGGECKCSKSGHKLHQGSRLDFPRAAEAALVKGAPFAGYTDFEDCVSKNSDKRDPSAYCGEIKHRTEDQRTAASSLTQVQQITDPNNAPTPQADDLPEGVAFPLNEAWSQQWVTGPGGAEPKGATPQTEAAMDIPKATAKMFGHMDALDGRDPQHRDHYPFSAVAHGAYLRGWNANHATLAAQRGTDPFTREGYTNLTGRPDLFPHWRESYETAKRYYGRDTNQGKDIEATGSRKQADAWSQPRQTTDDATPPYSEPATNVPMTPGGGDYEAGAAAGKADKAAGERPAFADNSSGVSPYVKGYAEAYGAASEPQGAQDVPYSMGGDSGQGMNAGEAQRAFQVSKASRVSAAFVPPPLRRELDFSKAYKFAQIWEPGTPLVRTGSAAFEAGLYAGITDRPGMQDAFLAAHALQAGAFPELARRVALHRSFSVKAEGKYRGLRTQGAYLVRKAGTTTDLITDGPGVSPDPMGATPLNGPGTPPPMGGADNANAPGGAPPYQGAPPLPGGPVVPDDVMGRSQEQPQPSGPFTNTFSGDHPENATLAPVAPNSAAQPGYSRKDVYGGDPHGGDRVAAFRRQVQAGLQRMASPVHDEVHKHLRRAKQQWANRQRAHPHVDLPELSTLMRGSVSPRDLESVLGDLVAQGRAKSGPAYGEWEASE